jgi:hypothetical protein
MKSVVVMALLVAAASTGLVAGTDVTTVAVHVEPHSAWDCVDLLPDVGIDALRTTYDGVGKIDAFVVFYNYRETRGLSFTLNWPEAWGEGSWHDCGDMRLGSIKNPHDGTSIVWQNCRPDTAPLVAGWLTVTVTSPGRIEVMPSHREGVISVLDCDDESPAISEAMISLKAGAGGVKGDDAAELVSAANRGWHVLPDSSGDAPTINWALRKALPGDTLMVAGGTYYEDVILREGIVVLGSWDHEFTTRSVDLSPSIIEASGYNTAVRCTFGADSSTVLDGFVIANGSSKQGGGVCLRNGAKLVLRNLIIHSNAATYGAGIFCHASSPTITNCLIASNDGDMGGGIYCTLGSSPVISNTTVVANHARTGAAIAVTRGSSPTIQRSIIADHPQPSSIYAEDEDSGITLSCCDLWRNETPQYGGGTDQIVELRDNMSEDPQFRDALEMDFTPLEGSPVWSVPNCGRIGSELHRLPME